MLSDCFFHPNFIFWVFLLVSLSSSHHQLQVIIYIITMGIILQFMLTPGNLFGPRSFIASVGKSTDVYFDQRQLSLLHKGKLFSLVKWDSTYREPADVFRFRDSFNLFPPIIEERGRCRSKSSLALSVYLSVKVTSLFTSLSSPFGQKLNRRYCPDIESLKVRLAYRTNYVRGRSKFFRVCPEALRLLQRM